MTILIATGMRSEAKVLTRDGVIVAVGALDPTRLESELEAGVAAGAKAILSMGLAGGLAPLLKPGDWVIGTLSPTGMERREWSVGTGASRPREPRPGPQPVTRKDGSRDWINRLARALPGAVVGRIHADGRVAASARQKEDLHFTTRAIACDMESHIAARVAERHDLPFAVARVVSDSADRTLPSAVLVAVDLDGGVKIGAVLWALLKRPWQIPALIGVALDARRAMKCLARGYDALASTGFALGDQCQLPLDVA